MPLSALPAFIFSGGRPSLLSIDAPIAAKGSVTRRIGRPDKEVSPVKVLAKFCPASKPLNKRIEVPELPK